MPSEGELLERGYFPREVQPPFVSSTFARVGVKLTEAEVSSAATSRWWTAPTKHNLARPGGMRRPLAIPNPLGYLKVARQVGLAWPTHLEPIIRGSVLAGSKLVPSTGLRTVKAAFSNADQLMLRAERRRGARYLLKADVQSFYPSIYTHAIDWAIHGKAAAKAATTKTVGAEIDRMFRGAQDGQSVGIPIGPDASLIIAECMMTRIEEALAARLPGLTGYRFWDDFELSFGSLGEAEESLGILQEALGAYELMLNPRKTEIIELPDPLLTDGIFEFMTWDLSSTSRGQRRQLVGYFDTLSTSIAANPGRNVAAYGVARLRSAKIRPENWVFVQNNLLQLLVAEPSCARFVAEILGRAATAGHLIDRAVIAEAVERLTQKHAPLGHGSEIAWALWLSLAHGIPLTKATADSIAGLPDNLVALLALHASDSGWIPTGLDTSIWESYMTTPELRGPNWLLAYEASIKGWLPSLGVADHIAGDAFFRLLRHKGVSFYDVTKLSLEPALIPEASGQMSTAM
ncbi:MAG: RNA-directed DNA polymerase [Pseudomonadota bacterium]